MIDVYVNSSDPKAVNKNLQFVRSLKYTIKESSNVVDPVLYVKYNTDLLTCNYCYVEEFNRYYYVRNITVSNKHTIELELMVDVLMSYADQIKGMYALVTKQEFDYNAYYIDPDLLVRCDKQITTQNVGQFGVDNAVRYYLTATGGGE